MGIDLTGPNLRSVAREFKADFWGAFNATQPWYTKIATEVTSKSAESVFAWLNELPRFREWVGSRIIKDLATSEYTLRNKDYEESFKLPVNAIDDDTYGVYRPVVQEIGRQAARWPDDLVAEALLAGTSRLCFDGQAFFSTSHPCDPADPASAVYSNYYANGKALDATNFKAVRAGMLPIKGADGRPLGVRPNLLIVPPSLEVTALEIVSAALVTNGGTNVLQSMAQVLVIPELEVEPTAWYLADMTRVIKPIIFQKRRAPRWIAKDRIDDDNVAYLREIHFLADARGAAGYSLPFLLTKAKA